MKCALFAALSLALSASARSGFISAKRASFSEKNGQDAIKLKFVQLGSNQRRGDILTSLLLPSAQFQSLTPNSKCSDGENACVEGKFAQCANGKFVLKECGSGLV